MKNGADVRVLDNHPAPDGELSWRGAIVRNAKRIADQASDEDPLAGYLVLGLYENGGASLGYRYNFECPNAMPRMLIPNWIAEIIRRDIISEPEAKEVFHEMFKWQDGF